MPITKLCVSATKTTLYIMLGTRMLYVMLISRAMQNRGVFRVPCASPLPVWRWKKVY